MYLSEKEQDQLIKAIEAFEKGEEQPEGRFQILKKLDKEE